jgi:hypothetical protein
VEVFVNICYCYSMVMFGVSTLGLFVAESASHASWSRRNAISKTDCTPQPTQQASFTEVRAT